MNLVKYCLVVCLFFFTSFVNANSLQSQNEIKPLLEKVMAKIAKGNIAEAIMMVKPYMTLPGEQAEAMILQSKSSRKQSSEIIGKTFGYEYLGKKKVASSLIRFVYLEKSEKAPIIWTFIFYKNHKGWVMPSFR